MDGHSGEILHQDRWIVVREKRYLDRVGREKRWSYVERRGGRQAVVIAARTAVSASLLVVEQPRVPFDRWVAEFPAGLVDQGEEPEATALRELREETGYGGRLRRLSAELPTSAGLSTEVVYLAEVEAEENPRAAPTPESSERISVVKLPPGQFSAYLSECERRGVLVDAKLYVYLTVSASS